MGKLTRAGLDLITRGAAVAAAASTGAVWIAVHYAPGRGQVHALFQVLALAENVAALALCRRKPAGALAGILAVYLAVDLVWVTGLPLLLALVNLAVLGGRRAIIAGTAVTAATVVVMPYLHGDHQTAAASLAGVAAVGLAVAAGGWLRLQLAARRIPQPVASGAADDRTAARPG